MLASDFTGAVAIALECHQHDDTDSVLGHCCTHGEGWIRAWPDKGCEHSHRVAGDLLDWLRRHPEALDG